MIAEEEWDFYILDIDIHSKHQDVCYVSHMNSVLSVNIYINSHSDFSVFIKKEPTAYDSLSAVLLLI